MPHMVKIKFKTIESTHKYAIELINKNKAMECIIIADEQTGGVGRGNRSWNSVKGNLFASMLLNNSKIDFNLAHLSMLTACALWDAISSYLNQHNGLTLHWPNDVYYNNKKISGILLAKIDNWVVISFGLNIKSVPNLDTAISMSELQKLKLLNDSLPTPQEMSECFLEKFKKWTSDFKKLGFSCIKEHWLRNIKGIDEIITVRNGNECLIGVFKDIDNFGRIILEKDGKFLYISTGDMFLDPERILKKYD